ncbi:CLUMA_CG007161, isoform A [Clunio marinus]|uniref:CLUMA_CG007161, isoform A n=1 Tax=Clunio marinus TaxID=568069 RepID=A0A1J1HZV1_9DIPT|nr:CLUMA_CG007161, isoform A [Clunio marinus]
MKSELKFMTANNNDFHNTLYVFNPGNIQRVADNQSRKKKAFDSRKSLQQSAAFNYIQSSRGGDEQNEKK